MLPSSRVRLLPCQRSSAENLFAAPRFAARVLSAPSTSAMQCPVGRSSWGVSLKCVCYSYKSPLTRLVPQPTCCFFKSDGDLSSTDLLCKCGENSVTVDETFKDGPTVILQSRSRWFPTKGRDQPCQVRPKILQSWELARAIERHAQCSEHSLLRSIQDWTWAYFGRIIKLPHVSSVSIFFTLCLLSFLSRGGYEAALHAQGKQFGKYISQLES